MANIDKPQIRYKYNPFREEVIEKLVTGKRFVFSSPKGDNTFAMVNPTLIPVKEPGPLTTMILFILDNSKLFLLIISLI